MFAPNGTLPLYGVNVYVPTTIPVRSPTACSAIAATTVCPAARSPQTTTDEAGHFALDNVPATSDVPLVIQIGKWRRQLKIAERRRVSGPADRRGRHDAAEERRPT